MEPINSLAITSTTTADEFARIMAAISAPAQRRHLPHFTMYLAFRMKKGLLAHDATLSDGQIVKAVGDIEHLNALDGSKQFEVTDFQGKRYRVTIAEVE